MPEKRLQRTREAYQSVELRALSIREMREAYEDEQFDMMLRQRQAEAAAFKFPPWYVDVVNGERKRKTVAHHPV